MLRLGIEYDVLPRESEILHLKFWATAFELLKQRKAIYFETEGKNKGCWVMPATAFSETATEEDDSKVIVRSNGTVTYVGKDIAYQLWKFGLLGKDFFYRKLLEYPDGHALYVSMDHDPGKPAPSFGRGSACLQRHRLPAIISAGRCGGGIAGPGFPRASRELDSLLL